MPIRFVEYKITKVSNMNFDYLLWTDDKEYADYSFDTKEGTERIDNFVRKYMYYSSTDNTEVVVSAEAMKRGYHCLYKVIYNQHDYDVTYYFTPLNFKRLVIYLTEKIEFIGDKEVYEYKYPLMDNNTNYTCELEYLKLKNEKSETINTGEDLAANDEINSVNDLEETNKTAAKFDKGKPMLSLVPTQIIKEIAAIRKYGTKKYKDADNWKTVEKERYVNAMLRHIEAYLNDPDGVDEESGLPHLSHAACNIAFILEMDGPNWEKVKNQKTIVVRKEIEE